MRLSLPLSMICDYFDTIMQNEFQIIGGQARPEEMNDAVMLRLGFVGPDDFNNIGRLEAFAEAVRQTAEGMNRIEAASEDFDDGPPSIQYDVESRVLFAENPLHYVDFLDQLSRRQGLFLEVPVTRLAGFGPGFTLTDEFRACAEASLQNPQILKTLDASQPFQDRDGLYRAILAAESYGQHRRPRPLFTLEDIRGAFRAEQGYGRPSARRNAEPTFWLH